MEFLYGRRPVYEALVANRRHIRRVIVAEGVDESGTLAGIVEDAQTQGVRVERMNRRWLDQRVDGANHQGVLIEVEPQLCALVMLLLGKELLADLEHGRDAMVPVQYVPRSVDEVELRGRRIVLRGSAIVLPHRLGLTRLSPQA